MMNEVKVWIGFCVAQMCGGLCDLDNVVLGPEVVYLMKIAVIGWIGCYPLTWLRFFFFLSKFEVDRKAQIMPKMKQFLN